MTMRADDQTSETTDQRKRRRKGIVAWGVLAGVAALATTAAFTDRAYLNLGGSNGIGGSDSTYNIQVGATDAAGNFVEGWQEADDEAGVDILIDGADSLYPGSDPVSIDIPVRNDSTVFGSTLALTLLDRAPSGDPELTSDEDYLEALRFDVRMPAVDGQPAVEQTDLIFEQVQALELSDLGPDVESVVTVSIRLGTFAEHGLEHNSLMGKGAFVQAIFDGSSI